MEQRGLDHIDGEILQLLQINARMANKDMAEQLGIAPSTCLERVRRLVEEKVLVGFRGEVCTEAMGVEVQALVSVRLGARSRQNVEAFRNFALKQQEVVAVFHLTGPADFLLHVAMRDTSHLQDFLVDALGSRKEVAGTEGSVLLQVDRSYIMPDYASDRDPKNVALQRQQAVQELKVKVNRPRDN